MGIKFFCLHCGESLNVKDFLAGKRGICPHCHGKIKIPRSTTANEAIDPVPAAEDIPVAARTVLSDEAKTNPPVAHLVAAPGISVAQAAEANADAALVANAIDEAPQLMWFVMPQGSMTKYGPANGETMRSWIRDGRITGDCLVLREDWTQWRAAAATFAGLSDTADVPAVARPVVAAGVVVAAEVGVPRIEAKAIESSRPIVAASSARRSRTVPTWVVATLIAMLVILAPIVVYVLFLHSPAS